MGGELVSHAWCVRTGGALTSGQRRRLLLEVVGTYPALVADVLRLSAGAEHGAVAPWPVVGDEVRDAVVAATARQGPALQGHGLRTWALGGLLAEVHGVPFDGDELFVAALAHDVGLTRQVPGEDFTVRSARAAVAAWAAVHGPPAPTVADRLRDAVVAHTTPGVDPAVSPLGWVVQAGAVADLVGRHLADLDAAIVDDVYERFPQGGLRRRITAAVAAEARAVPDGRFALLRRTGFNLAIRAAPHRDR